MNVLTRRALVAASGLAVTGCDRLVLDPKARAIAKLAESATYRLQRLAGRDALAREFDASEISAVFKANGTTRPVEADYQAHAASGFMDWQVKVHGLVAQPLSLGLADLAAMPAREQITRHDCVEGWSAIGGWAGPPLALVLEAARVRTSARYVLFLCADHYNGGKARYYESIDLIDAWHPQTILALRLNGQPLDVAHGAPVRLRVERQLGYKHAKYVQEIVLADSLSGFGKGSGGYWEDRGYEWYAGI